jgi:hypothetical protein
MWKARIRDALPVAAGGFTWWITNGSLERIYKRYEEACSMLEQNRVLYSCSVGADYEMMSFTCIASSIFAGYIAWWIYCRPHQGHA